MSTEKDIEQVNRQDQNIIQDLAMAFSPPVYPQALNVQVTKAYWTPHAMALFADIYKLAEQHFIKQGAKDKNVTLPTSALRNLLHGSLPNLLSTNQYLGLGPHSLYRKDISLCGLFKQNIHTVERFYACLDEWIEHEMTGFIERYDIPDHFREEMYGLADNTSLVTFTDDSLCLYPWISPHVDTAPSLGERLTISANDIAVLLEGEVIFPELPPVRRVAGHGGNRAELVTLPINDHQEGRFSLVCEISVETLPTDNTPIININFKKRRWLESLNNDYTRALTKSGYLIESEGTRAYHFCLEKNQTNNWKWTPDSAFSALERRFDLTFTEALMFQEPSDQSDFIGIVHDYENEGDQKNEIGAGVPEKDRKDAFDLISQILSKFGFTPFSAFERVKSPIKAFSNVTYMSKLVKDKPTDIKLEAADSLYLGQPLPPSLFEYDDIDALTAGTKVYLPDLIQGYLSDENVTKHVKSQTLFLVSQSAAEGEVLKRIAYTLFGDCLTIKSVSLPELVHGPRVDLPSSEVKNKHTRKSARKKQWEGFVKSLSEDSMSAICLIQAPMFYETSSGPKPDDEVNKPAAKLAFSSEQGFPVQYLLPPDTRSSSTTKLEKYIMQAQQALLDLIFGHLGKLPNLSKRTSHYHSDEKAPKYLYGINMFTATTETRASKAEIIVASRVCIESGLTEIKIAHSTAQNVITDWMPFRNAIQYLTKRSEATLSLGKSWGDKQHLVKEFCSSILDEAQKSTPHAYVYIKAEGCRSYWNWLGDSGVADFATHAKSKWSLLRIVRVRDQAPKLLQHKIVDGHDKPTTTPSLFKLHTTDLPVYWSLGEPIQQYTRGLSCYRTLTVSQANPKTKEKVVKTFSPDIKQAMRPNATEFTLISSLPEDEPDTISQFSASLRRGLMPARLETWVKSPSPIFVMNKLEEYLKL